ncbi:globin [Corynebacterium massiliense]|uniref:Group 2 truncated hemoglobin GlbO n=1 Tax=Corynebacterium massiliense DSM 45435 TaxID=1121364 RepID=A0ABY7U8R9_9CORY|nr:globin [Corynebacterium massiliense]WCZ33046.1 Group 2 truncated hemoglobin GlbO [Corynebacterium massiliense DSM 45435]
MQISGPGISPGNVYEAIGGEATFDQLVDGFYAQVPDDDILGPMYPPEDMAGARRRLKLFLIQYWGGPNTYSAERGHPRLRMRHHPFRIDRAAAERWLTLMGNSFARIDDETIPPAYRSMMWDHMERVSAMLVNTPD